MTPTKPTRRDLLRLAATVTAATVLPQILQAQRDRGPAARILPLNDRWTCAPAENPLANPTAAQPITLPHTAVPLSWQSWDPDAWQRLWLYQTTFPNPLKHHDTSRVFLHCDAVMAAATPTLNQHKLDPHQGGFLPFEREITTQLAPLNQLSLLVDGRCINVPPNGPKGPAQIDYLTPAGIPRPVSLRIVPQTFLADVFAQQADVLDPAQRRLELSCTLDTTATTPQSFKLRAELLELSPAGEKPIAQASTTAQITQPGRTDIAFNLNNLASTALWSPANPKLYTLRVTLTSAHAEPHTYTTRIGLREAKFTVEGFFLNGEQFRIFGLNRHELFPYTGFAMPANIMRRDAEILRHDLNLNMVRCSHYPQSDAFLDACDELGLMIWEEIPGWQYIGDAPWQRQLFRDIETMVLRDRNRPSVVIWGVRVNESADNVPLYTRTRALAKKLDPTRPTSGTMTHLTKDKWVQDVFTYDDYHNGPDGHLAMHDPVEGVPFLFGEAVGQFGYEHGGGFKQFYRRAGARDVQEGQAKWHAQGHDRGANHKRVCGVIAWCAFEYGSLINGFKTVKTPGVIDVFRIPKLGATFYQSQVSPAGSSPHARPVIAPSFYWDFSDGQGPGAAAHIFSNCEQLIVTAGTHPPVTLQPDRTGYPNLAYPPFVADLSQARAGDELLLEGFVAGRSVLTQRLSSDRSRDQLLLTSDFPTLPSNAYDLTRVWFSTADAHGTLMRRMEGQVTLTLTGPAELIGDKVFTLADTGGVGAIWLRAIPNRHGSVTITATHPTFLPRTLTLTTS
jgi:beta-galactosidase